MAEFTADQRRHGKDISEAICVMAAESSDEFIKRELYKAANSIRRHYGYSEAEKESEVLRQIRIGAASVTDLVRETGFTPPDISNITQKLERSKLIRVQRANLLGNGRPALLFFPVE